MCFVQVITTKCGVLCKNKHMLWFYAKQAPTCGVICYFLGEEGSDLKKEEVGAEDDPTHLDSGDGTTRLSTTSQTEARNGTWSFRCRGSGSGAGLTGVGS
jgi:hypothetical protein